MTKAEKIVFLLRNGMFLSVYPVLADPGFRNGDIESPCGIKSCTGARCACARSLRPRGFWVSVGTDLGGLHTFQREVYGSGPDVGEVILDTILELAEKHRELWWRLEKAGDAEP